MRHRRTTKRYTLARGQKGKSDWRRVDAQTDREIVAAADSDSDAVPIASAAWFRRARIVLPEPKQPVSLRLDQDVLRWFKRQGKGYQTRINAVLRAYMRAQDHL